MGFPVVNLGALGAENQAPLPTPSGALYRPPNPDGSRKACANCLMWVSMEKRCTIHARDIEIESSLMCGYHVFGAPMERWMDHPGIMPVTPDLSGLRWAGPGVACASCKFYRAQGDQVGLCVGVSDPDTRRPGVSVASRGWCARYEGM